MPLLFPEKPREFPGRRALKILLRAVHVLFVGVLVGAHVFAVGETGTAVWFNGTLASGVLLLLLDLHESAVFLLQTRGLVVIGKILVLAFLPWYGTHQAAALCALVLISVVSSHAPSKVRYAVLIARGKVRASHSRG